MSISAYLEAVSKHGLNTICLTNHGNVEDYLVLKQEAPAGLTVIPGVEISSEYGDFLIFSTDFDFLSSLKILQGLPPREDRPKESAVVWAHPFAGLAGKQLPEDFVKRVAVQVDGIEVYNGNWPDEEASERAREIAGRYDLAELGGSDAHRCEDLLKCYTEVKVVVASAAELIGAIKNKLTQASFPQLSPRSWQ